MRVLARYNNILWTVCSISQDDLKAKTFDALVDHLITAPTADGREYGAHRVHTNHTMTPTMQNKPRDLRIAASPVNDVAFGGDLPVGLASVEFTVKEKATPPAGLQRFSPNAMSSAYPVSTVMETGSESLMDGKD